MATKKYLDEAGAAYLVSKILGLLKNKTDKEEGKTLSDENFTAELKNKLEELENYSLPIASIQELGGVKIGSGLTIDSETGTVSANGGGTADSIDWDNIQNKPATMTNQEIDALFDE